jgi:hypothetical protein
MTKLRTVLGAMAGAGAFLIGVPTALAEAPATSPRADAYDVVMCLAPDSTEWQSYEAFDAHAADIGNRDDQVESYGQHHAGWTCTFESGE